jgi:Tol biopolymer transport system component
MGEVFAARDTRLGRLVAVKVLPRELASDPGRRARFEREARAISALSHPHVCALFDVGRTDGPDGGIDYLVMERLEGETLAARLARGPLAVPEVLALGSQLAGALAAAHRRGIVHRDVKPANVMLTRSGAKLVDFGLAGDGEREARQASAEAATHTVATEEKPLTQVGTLVGTWPYLSPERVRGAAADARSDVFALGCVLHEALTGRRAFDGPTPSDVQAAILGHEPPDVRDAVPTTPPALALLVRQCLAKDPDARWQCADDVARGLHLAEAAPAQPAGPQRPAASRWPLALGAGLLAVAIAVAAGMLHGGRPRPAKPLLFSVIPPPGVMLSRPTAGTAFAVSPDGRKLVFNATAAGPLSLWLWSAEDGQTRPLEDTVGAISPFFSPDGREIGFIAGDELRRISVDGGPATTVTKAPGASSGSWGSAGTILLSRPIGADAGIYSVATSGGEPRLVGAGSSARDQRAYARFLPDGRHYLFMMGYGTAVEDRRLCVAALEGGEPDCFAGCQTQGEYSSSGHVLCVRGGTLVAVPFDAASRRPTGEAVPVVREVRWVGPSGAASFAVSADGRTLVHEPRPAASRLAWVDRSGRETAAVGEPGAYGMLQLAPDGRRAAVDVLKADGRGRDLWSLDTSSGVATLLTFQGQDSLAGAWSPDGARIAYAKAVDGPPDIAVLELDGTNQERLLLRAPGIQLPKHWSPDGRLIAYEQYSAGRRDQRQLWLLSLDGTTRRVTQASASSYSGRFSPDGRSFAYVSEESGTPEVYVAPLAGGPARRVSRTGGRLPRWSGDGRELFFLQADGLMKVAPARDETAPLGSLFHQDGVSDPDFDYDVARDGQRFLVRLTHEPEGTAGLRIALEWSERLATATAEKR